MLALYFWHRSQTWIGLAPSLDRPPLELSLQGSLSNQLGVAVSPAQPQAMDTLVEVLPTDLSSVERIK